MPQVTINGTANDTGRFANQSRQVDNISDQCPICHRHIVPEFAAPGFEFGNRLELFLRCTNTRCWRSFISLYELDQGLTQVRNSRCYRFLRSVPAEPEPAAISPAVEELSPAFVKIWTQAQTAEAQGLDDIAGPGYRKALEFLVKDYAISLVADDIDKAKIKAIPLQAVIKAYLTGDRLPVVSSRAAWLGNDETHYERRWVDKDLTDLKKLIEATAHFIAMAKLAADIPVEMPERKVEPGS